LEEKQEEEEEEEDVPKQDELDFFTFLGEPEPEPDPEDDSQLEAAADEEEKKEEELIIILPSTPGDIEMDVVLPETPGITGGLIPALTPTRSYYKNNPLDQFAKWLEADVQLPQFLPNFIENQLANVCFLYQLDEETLQEIGIALKVHRKHILVEVRKFTELQKKVWLVF